MACGRIGRMPEQTSYEPGTPSWVDLTTPDVDASTRFYGGLFGWEAESAGPVEETGGYAMFKLNGRNVAGVGPVMQEGQPPVWSTYISTDDADGAVARATGAGAAVLVEPMDVMDAGRMAFIAHPAGGTVGLWQPGRTTGAELVNEPGALNWNELHTRDVDGAKAFYSALFGWTYEDSAFGGMTYTVFNLNDRGIGGIMPMQPGVPDEVPANWVVYFAVADCDAAVAKAQELGGTVMSPPMDIEGVGRFAALADPHGSNFAVITGVPPEE
jgi:predicted enzyme related to lactoylglutathione lyase